MAADFNSVKIVKEGTIEGDEKATGGIDGTDTYYPFGGSSDLWGLGWTVANINSSTFGVVFSFVGTGHAVNFTSHYLKATNFSFSIPAGATINGIKAEIEASHSVVTTRADHVRMTVYYTEAATGTNMQINIGDAWKEISAMQINIGDVWKDVAGAQINIGDVWKTIF